VRHFCIHDIDAWHEALGLHNMRLLASWTFWVCPPRSIYSVLLLQSFLSWLHHTSRSSSTPRSISCAHARWKSRASGTHPLHRVHLLGWRAAIAFLESVRKRHDYSLFIFTASFLHCTVRDDYTNKAPCFHRVHLALP
jgi:hypothetical protein